MPTGPRPGPADQSDAEARLEFVAPGYLALVRRAAQRIGRRDGAFEDVEAAVNDVADSAAIDVDVPIISQRRAVRLLKRAVKPLVGWYLRYLGQQVTVLGEAVTRLGRALAARADALEVRTDALAQDVDGLRSRIERLEGRDRFSRDDPTVRPEDPVRPGPAAR